MSVDGTRRDPSQSMSMYMARAKVLRRSHLNGAQGQSGLCIYLLHESTVRTFVYYGSAPITSARQAFCSMSLELASFKSRIRQPCCYPTRRQAHRRAVTVKIVVECIHVCSADWDMVVHVTLLLKMTYRVLAASQKKGGQNRLL